MDVVSYKLSKNYTDREVTRIVKNFVNTAKNINVAKRSEKFEDLFNLDYTTGIKVIDGSVAGTRQLTIDATATQSNHTNCAIYNALDDVRGYAVELESGFNGKVRLGFGNDINNFSFINFTSGEYYLVVNGVLQSTMSLTDSLMPVTFVDGDKLKVILYGKRNILVFKNNVLTSVFNSAKYPTLQLDDLNKNYPAISFRDGTAGYAYGVNKIEVHQKSYPKFMHLSIDDEIGTLSQLTTQLPTSIFSIPNFAFLKSIHEKYGAVFTLYLFNTGGGFSLDMVTDAYKEEFKANSSWLKFGFHGQNSTADYDTLDAVTAKADWDTIMTQIARFAGSQCIDSMPRTSNFKGNIANVRAWRDTANYNATGFLTADDTRTIDLYLNTLQKTAIRSCTDMYDSVEKLFLMHSDLRLDAEVNPYDTLEARKSDMLYNGQNDAQIIFWHYAPEYTDTVKNNVIECCEWAVDNGHMFLYPMNVNPNF